jgi:histidyl-tRNA synthetase
MREANRTGVKLAVIIGEKELQSQKVQVKDLHKGEQSEIKRESLIDHIVHLNL